MGTSSTRYRTVHCLIWNDDKFPYMSDYGKLVFLHLLTTTFSSPFGCFKAGKASLLEESRMNLEGFGKGFAEGLKAGLFKYDERTLTILLPNFLKHNKPANPNVVKMWGKLFSELPDGPLKNENYLLIKACCEGLGKGFAEGFAEGFREPCRNHMPIQEQEQEQEQNNNNLSASDEDGGVKEVEEETFYLSKKKRKLKGKVLENFNLFWAAFAYPKAKAEAADAWLDVYSQNLVDAIINAARIEAAERPRIIAQGKTPKYAQGWLSGRRWEDSLGEDGSNKLFDCERCNYKLNHQTTCWKEGRKTCSSYQKVEL